MLDMKTVAAKALLTSVLIPLGVLETFLDAFLILTVLEREPEQKSCVTLFETSPHAVQERNKKTTSNLRRSLLNCAICLGYTLVPQQNAVRPNSTVLHSCPNSKSLPPLLKGSKKEKTRILVPGDDNTIIFIPVPLPTSARSTRANGTLLVPSRHSLPTPTSSDGHQISWP